MNFTVTSQDEYEQQLAARTQELEARFESRLAAMRAELEAEYARRLAEKDTEIEELKRKCDETQDDLDQLLLCLVRGASSYPFCASTLWAMHGTSDGSTGISYGKEPQLFSVFF